MITDIKTFIANAKELYPDFSFEPYDEKLSFEEKFKYFKELDEKLKEKYGKGYFKAKEEIEKFWSIYDEEFLLPITCEETNIIYSLYSADSDLDKQEYRSAAIKMATVPTIIANSIIDEYCDEKDVENSLFVTAMMADIRVAELSYESIIHYNYKTGEPHLPWYEQGTMAEFEIKDAEQVRLECKELLRRNMAVYEDICFIISDLWTVEDLIEFAKSESEMIRMLVCCQVNCSKDIAKQLMKDECNEVAFAAAEKYEELVGNI